MNIKKYIQAAESDYIRIGNKLIPKDTSKFSYDDSYDDIIYTAIAKHSDYAIGEIEDERTLLHAD